MLTQENAALTIQRNWCAFVEIKRGASDEARRIATLIGEKVSSAEDVVRCINLNKIIIQANGSSNNPIDGHSCFYVGSLRKHLVLLNKETIEMRALQYSSKYPVHHHPKSAGAHAVIIDNDLVSINRDFRKRINHLNDKGSIFVFHDMYTKYFDTAFRLESIHFKHGPYSYGLHYKQYVCNKCPPAISTTFNVSWIFYFLCLYP